MMVGELVSCLVIVLWAQSATTWDYIRAENKLYLLPILQVNEPQNSLTKQQQKIYFNSVKIFHTEMSTTRNF